MKSSIPVNYRWGSACSCCVALIRFRLPIGGPVWSLHVCAPLPVPGPQRRVEHAMKEICPTQYCSSTVLIHSYHWRPLIIFIGQKASIYFRVILLFHFCLEKFRKSLKKIACDSILMVARRSDVPGDYRQNIPGNQIKMRREFWANFGSAFL